MPGRAATVGVTVIGGRLTGPVELTALGDARPLEQAASTRATQSAIDGSGDLRMR